MSRHAFMYYAKQGKSRFLPEGRQVSTEAIASEALWDLKIVVPMDLPQLVL